MGADATGLAPAPKDFVSLSFRMRSLLAMRLGFALVAVVVGAWSVVGGGRSMQPTVALGPPRYVDEAATAGVDHTYGGGDATFIGGGVAVFDCDSDGSPDLYLSGGANPSVLFRNDSRPAAELTFTDATDAAIATTGVMGAYPLDIDGDGRIDLAVLRVDGAELLRGVGDCAFEPGDEAASMARMKALLSKRVASQPLNQPNAAATP